MFRSSILSNSTKLWAQFVSVRFDFSVLHQYWHQFYTNIVFKFIDQPIIHDKIYIFLKNSLKAIKKPQGDAFLFSIDLKDSSKHPAILHTKSSNKIYLWLEGSLVSQLNVCGGFFFIFTCPAGSSQHPAILHIPHHTKITQHFYPQCKFHGVRPLPVTSHYRSINFWFYKQQIFFLIRQVSLLVLY